MLSSLFLLYLFNKLNSMTLWYCKLFLTSENSVISCDTCSYCIFWIRLLLSLCNLFITILTCFKFCYNLILFFFSIFNAVLHFFSIWYFFSCLNVFTDFNKTELSHLLFLFSYKVRDDECFFLNYLKRNAYIA